VQKQNPQTQSRSRHTVTRMLMVGCVLIGLGGAWLLTRQKEGNGDNSNYSIPTSNPQDPLEKSRPLAEVSEHESTPETDESEHESTPDTDESAASLITSIAKNPPPVSNEANGGLVAKIGTFRGQLLRTMFDEDIETTINHVANIDEAHLADTADGTMRGTSTGKYQSHSAVRLMRTRRLLEVGETDAASVIPGIRKRLATLMTKADAAYTEFHKVQEENRGVVADADRYAWTGVSTASPPLVYLLVELGDHGSIPLLASIASHGLSKEYPVQRVVAPDFLAYGIYQLCESYPRSELSSQQLSLLDEVQAAGKIFAPPKELEVVKWNAAYSEYDLRRTVMRKNIGLDKQPKMTVRFWDLRFNDDSPTGDSNGYSDDRATDALRKMIAFAESLGQ